MLDKPSEASVNHVQAVQLGELVTPAQQQSIRSLKEEGGIGQDGERRGKKRKKKISNPNPLSCLKKKKLPTQPLNKRKTEGEEKKRTRNRRRKSAGGEGLSVNPVPNP